eukprot:2475245-Rhodomonas_salina.1
MRRAGTQVLETLTGNCGYALSTPLATMFHIGRGTPPNIPEDLDPSARSMVGPLCGEIVPRNVWAVGFAATCGL